MNELFKLVNVVSWHIQWYDTKNYENIYGTSIQHVRLEHCAVRLRRSRRRITGSAAADAPLSRHCRGKDRRRIMILNSKIELNFDDENSKLNFFNYCKILNNQVGIRFWWIIAANCPSASSTIFFYFISVSLIDIFDWQTNKYLNLRESFKVFVWVRMILVWIMNSIILYYSHTRLLLTTKFHAS